MRTHRNTVVIGAGQAGLAASWWLVNRGIDHVVLERGLVAEKWRSQRWDSFTLLSPNWQTRLPGHAYAGPDPEGFMTGAETAAFLADYARSFAAPVRSGVTVTRVQPGEDGWVLETSAGPVDGVQRDRRDRGAEPAARAAPCSCRCPPCTRATTATRTACRRARCSWWGRAPPGSRSRASWPRPDGACTWPSAGTRRSPAATGATTRTGGWTGWACWRGRWTRCPAGGRRAAAATPCWRAAPGTWTCRRWPPRASWRTAGCSTCAPASPGSATTSTPRSRPPTPTPTGSAPPSTPRHRHRYAAPVEPPAPARPGHRRPARARPRRHRRGRLGHRIPPRLLLALGARAGRRRGARARARHHRRTRAVLPGAAVAVAALVELPRRRGRRRRARDGPPGRPHGARRRLTDRRERGSRRANPVEGDLARRARFSSATIRSRSAYMSSFV